MKKTQLLLLCLFAATATQQVQAIDFKSFVVAALVFGSVQAEPTFQPTATNATRPTQIPMITPTAQPTPSAVNGRAARCPNCIRNNDNRPTVITGLRIMDQMRQEQVQQASSIR